jgi:hypothetical protein
MARKCMGKFWGPKPMLTKWLYTNIIRPTFTYGCIAWGKTTRTKSFQAKAKRLQRLALCNIGPIRQHSSTSGLEIFTHTIPLDLYIQGEIISAYLRIKPIAQHEQFTIDTTSSHIAWAEKLCEAAGIGNIPTDSIVPYFHSNKKFVCIPEQYNTYNKARMDKLQIFTDGSHIKNGNIGKTGCGYTIQKLDPETAIHNTIYETSINLG